MRHQQNRIRNTLNSVIVNLHGASYKPHRIRTEHFPAYAAEAEYLATMLPAKAPR